MMVALYLLLSYSVLLILYLLVLVFLSLTLKEDKPASSFKSSYPYVSVLVAARNEEENIVDCLRAIAALSWPADKLEVLIGNDQSTDGTEELVKEFIRDKSNFKLITINENLGQARGKANVLATLAREARGDYFYITDADIRVPTQWIQSLLANDNEKIAIVSGATKMEELSVLGYCQAVDWVYGFSMIKIVSDHNIPVSAVGNNMMIKAAAYKSTGGYENIPFSVTEDHQLFIETLKRGWTYKNMMSPDCLAITKPMGSISELLRQRKRWMQGAMKVPFILLLFLFLQAIFFPVVIATLFVSPVLGVGLWVTKILLHQIFMIHSYKRIKEPYNPIQGLILYELYAGLLSPLVILNYLIPTKVEWKGRKY